jgi:hypothetical protein
MTSATGHLQIGMIAAAMDDAEQREQLRPRPEPVIHGVRVTLGIGAQAFEESTHGVVSHVESAHRQQPAVLGEEHKDETQQHRHQPAVNLIRMMGGELTQQRAFRPRIGGLETAEQFIRVLAIGGFTAFMLSTDLLGGGNEDDPRAGDSIPIVDERLGRP